MRGKAEAIYKYAHRNIHNGIFKTIQDYRLPRSLTTSRNDAVVSFLSLRGMSATNDEAIYNLA
ncbi:hypothetical protein [Helicobacter rodentium]|uniref:hypothetical protein n=1 Tax=Helicobacter rodentium TaxID=59617 RepID=UPI000ABF51B1|nr:hypothetical protein [Helicobacter rodentium]